MEKYSNLTVIKEYRRRVGKTNRVFCDCVCDCGQHRTVRLDSLVDSRTKMCRECAKKEFSRKTTKHGLCGTRQHRMWIDMKQRCYNEKNTAYLYYGGKGVRICDEWRNDFLVFNKWLSENGYNDSLTVDRIDSSKMYCPENCRLITQSENTRIAHLGKKHVRRRV